MVNIHQSAGIVYGACKHCGLPLLEDDTALSELRCCLICADRIQREYLARYICPACGRHALSANDLCSGSFLDADHPPNVVPVIGSPPVECGGPIEELCNTCGESASVYLTGRDATTAGDGTFTRLPHCDEHADELRRDPLCEITAEEPVA